MSLNYAFILCIIHLLEFEFYILCFLQLINMYDCTSVHNVFIGLCYKDNYPISVSSQPHRNQSNYLHNPFLANCQTQILSFQPLLFMNIRVENNSTNLHLCCELLPDVKSPICTTLCSKALWVNKMPTIYQI